MIAGGERNIGISALKKLLNWKGGVVATVRTKLKAAELEVAIAKRLAERPECAGIIQVYVKATAGSLQKTPGCTRWCPDDRTRPAFKKRRQ